MMTKQFLQVGAGLLIATPALAHAPIFTCERDGSMVVCEAGYSDGSSAAGRPVTVLDADHRVLMESMIGEDGTYEFTPPSGTFHVVFDGGEYHEVTVYSDDLEDA